MYLLVERGCPSFVRVRSYSMEGYNWSTALVAFLRGSPLEDIALTFAIPLGALKTKAKRDGWNRLFADNSAALAPLPPARGDVAEEKLAKLEANRATNLAIAQKLQDDLAALVQELREGKLLIEKTTSIGVVVKVKPSIKDRLDLANLCQDGCRSLLSCPWRRASGHGRGGLRRRRPAGDQHHSARANRRAARWPGRSGRGAPA